MSQKFQEIAKAMGNSFQERDELITGMLVTLIAKENVFMMGPPGTAKSAISNALCNAITGNYFSWVMTKFTAPQELFGPPSLEALKRGSYECVTTGKLPEAHIGYIDELDKASSAISNTLLPIMNERVFFNGAKPTNIPLEMMIGSANGMPDGQELAAMNDRFALRYFVNRLQRDDSATFLFNGGKGSSKIPSMTIPELHAERKKAMALKISDEIIQLMLQVRREIDQEGIYVSDRKWVQSTRIIRAYAYLNGHKEVESEDLDILEHMLWTTPEQQKKVRQLVQKIANPLGGQVTAILDAVQDIVSTDISKMDNKQQFEAQKKVKDAIKRLEKLGGKDNPKVKTALKTVRDVNLKLLNELGME
jgi:MoxR-like ATPase